MSGKLYLVPTPIGNLEDITLRAIRILKEVDLILAEDTRTSGVLLKHYGISKPLQSHHIHNEHKTVETLANRINDGLNVALISDAGTPSISDPGFLLVRTCIENGIDVECLPGATSFVPALVVSGLPSDRFHFEGFLPTKKGRKTRLEHLAQLDCTVIFFESPHRIGKTLKELTQYFGGERKASLSRELSKLHEETLRGTLDELVEITESRVLKGEMVVVVGSGSGSSSRQDFKL
jgi:16S rRNA (cytidine1402-2'-O)-methyltransferase